LGLTHVKGSKPTKQETEIAKNYLDENELGMLNRMVTAYLELAEIQALNQQPMYMKDWVERLDDFVKMADKPLLQDAGSISHQQALEKATSEYEKYKTQTKNELSEAEKHFVEHLEKTAKTLKSKTKKK
jgi:hypothetical protein